MSSLPAAVERTSHHAAPPGEAADGLMFLCAVLDQYMESVVARGIIRYALKRSKVAAADLESGAIPALLVSHLNKGIEMFVEDEARRQLCKERMEVLIAERSRRLLGSAGAEAAGRMVPLTGENDIVSARHQARMTAELLGFSKTDQIKIATAVSELARNVVRYAGAGEVRIEAVDAPAPGIRISCRDHGPGIPNLDEVLSGKYRSKTGLGLGICGCRKIMDEFDIETGPDGTRITAIKRRG